MGWPHCSPAGISEVGAAARSSLLDPWFGLGSHLDGSPRGLSKRLPQQQSPAWGSSCALSGGGPFPSPPWPRQTALLGCWPRSSRAAGICFLSHRPVPRSWSSGAWRQPNRVVSVPPCSSYTAGGHGLAATLWHQRPW